jgi:uncharacterized protein
VELKNEFKIDVPAERAWPLLLDVATVIQCVPGAELIEQLSDGSFKGRISVKLGPVLLTFEGVVKFDEIDPLARRVRLNGRGADKKGRGSAFATVVMQLTPNGALSNVTAVTDLQLSGTVAQYGRASGLIADLSQQIVDEFTVNLNRRIVAAVARTPEEPHPFSATQPAVKPLPGFRLALRALWKALARLLGKRVRAF